MRTAVLGSLLATLLAIANPVHAASLTLDVPDTVSRADGTLSVTGAGVFDAPGRSQVFSDPQLDDALLLEATPPVQDLVAGFVEIDRPDETLNLTWQVVDIPDTGGIPEAIRYMWDLSITPAPGAEPVFFQVQAKASNIADGSGGPQLSVPAGEVNGDCAVTGTVITCTRIGEAEVTFDPEADEVTMRVPFGLLRDTSGAPALIEGARIETASIFQGIVAISQAVLSLGQTGDSASASGFLVGDHVQLQIASPGIPDDFLADGFMFHVPAAGDGTFATDLDIAPFPASDYELVGRACTDAACGGLQRAPFTVTE